MSAKVTCRCGRELVQIQADHCYHAYMEIECDKCDRTISGKNIVYHCQSQNCEYDLCLICASYASSPNNKIKQQDTTIKEMADIAKASCICGKQLFKIKASDCYPSGKCGVSVIICNKCNKRYSGNQLVYHCKLGQMRLHQSGYDLCVICAMLERSSSINTLQTDQQKESIQILDECELIQSLIQEIKLMIIDYCGELTGNDFINNLEYDDKFEQDLTNKKEWIAIKSKLAKWNKNEINTFSINSWSYSCPYGFNQCKNKDENKFALSLKPIIKQNVCNQDMLFHIKSNVSSAIKELEESQSVSDMYNSSRYPQYNWCIFIHSIGGRGSYGWNPCIYDAWSSFYIWDDNEWNDKITILELRKQITLKHRMNGNKRFWFLKIAEYEKSRRIGKDIYCIVEQITS